MLQALREFNGPLAKAGKKAVAGMVARRAEHGPDSLLWKLMAVGVANSGYGTSG
jgi:hypothetical protein